MNGTRLDNVGSEFQRSVRTNGGGCTNRNWRKAEQYFRKIEHCTGANFTYLGWYLQFGEVPEHGTF